MTQFSQQENRIQILNQQEIDFFSSQDVLFVSRGRKFASFLPNNRENGREEKFESTSGQQIGRAQLLRDTPWKTKIRSAPIFGSG